MSKTPRVSSTATSIRGEYTQAKVVASVRSAHTTIRTSSNDVVLIRGRLIKNEKDSGGRAEVQMSIEPRAVSRKLAIRKLNDQLEGRSLPSTTEVAD